MNALSPAEPALPVPPPFLAGAPVTYVVQPAPKPVRWRDRPLVWLAVTLTVAFALSFGLAPWFAYRAIRSAARYDDPAALAQLVDYEAVRQPAAATRRSAGRGGRPAAAQPPDQPAWGAAERLGSP